MPIVSFKNAFESTEAEIASTKAISSAASVFLINLNQDKTKTSYQIIEVLLIIALILFIFVMNHVCVHYNESCMYFVFFLREELIY